MSDTYVLASLDDEKAAKLGKIIANNTARKILNYLAEKNASESEIAEKLKVPLSTVHYNIKQLLDAGLVEVKDFYWSEKGNKVCIYSLTKKLVLIAPKNTNISRKKIKNLFYVMASCFAISLFLKFIYPLSNPAAKRSFAQSFAESAAKSSNLPFTHITQLATNYAIFFFGGALFALLLYLLLTRKTD